jgi:hypothetical protein
LEAKLECFAKAETISEPILPVTNDQNGTASAGGERHLKKHRDAKGRARGGECRYPTKE